LLRIKKKDTFISVANADTGYDSNLNDIFLKEKNYTPIIPKNKRNTKDKTKIRTLNEKEKKIYKQRIKVENYYSWIKKFNKINFIQDKKKDNFMGLLTLVNIIIINRNIPNC